MRSLVERIRGPHELSVLHLRLALLSGVSKIALPLLRSIGRDASCALQQLTLSASGPALRTTPQLDVTILMPALIALGRKYLVGPRQLAEPPVVSLPLASWPLLVC